MRKKNIVAFGGSAGATESMVKILKGIDPGTTASFFVVIHSSVNSLAYLQKIFERATALKVKYAQNDEPIDSATVYIAPANFHLIISSGKIKINQGPRENLMRPSIDVLFRSAAVNYNTQAIGVALSGTMDDGLVGMDALQKCGGTLIVESPDTALFPELPKNILDELETDFVLSAEKISKKINRLVNEEAEPEISVPSYLIKELKIAEKSWSNINKQELNSTPAPYVCPDCGGPLWEIKNDKHLRFRCDIGHAITANNLVSQKTEAFERAMWIGLRALEERKNLLLKLANSSKERNRSNLADDYFSKADEIEAQIDIMKDYLIEGGQDLTELFTSAKTPTS